MRKYGRRARPGRRGGLVVSKYEEYVHDCEIDCPDGHKDWRSVTFTATDAVVLDASDYPKLADHLSRFPWGFKAGRLHAP